MRVCATYGSKVPLKEGADMHEIRLDVFDEIPAGIGEGSVITLCGKDIDTVPDTFKGLVDVGESQVNTEHRKIRSIHDFERTPDPESIVKMLSTGDQEISKGAFLASSFRELASLLDASKELKRKHVLLCMGEIGKITRIRQNILGNEFTFGFVGEPTAPGQLSAEEMDALGDNCIITGIIGHPLAHSRSPAMQNAAIRKAGINGTYLTFDSDGLDRIEDVIRGYSIRGVNVTIPYKQKIINHLDEVSPIAEKVGAVNTVINDNGRLIGENTDVIGILDAMSGTDLENRIVLIMGSGGSARAAAYAFTESGCQVYVSGRNQNTVEHLCDDFHVLPFSGDVGAFDIIVNCTPIGLVNGDYPIDLTNLASRQTVFDMVYGRDTPLLSLAKERGCRIIDGKDMLVGQGAASFLLWFGRDPDRGVMRGALK